MKILKGQTLKLCAFREIGYEVSYSAARWPSGTTKLMECDIHDDLCMEKYRKNAAMVQVFYEELNYETLVESPAYPVSQRNEGLVSKQKI